MCKDVKYDYTYKIPLFAVIMSIPVYIAWRSYICILLFSMPREQCGVSVSIHKAVALCIGNTWSANLIYFSKLTNAEVILPKKSPRSMLYRQRFVICVYSILEPLNCSISCREEETGSNLNKHL